MIKIKNKGRALSPITTSPVWIIPTITYLCEKLVGTIQPDREWIWWVSIPVPFLIWFFYHYKLVKND